MEENKKDKRFHYSYEIKFEFDNEYVYRTITHGKERLVYKDQRVLQNFFQTPDQIDDLISKLDPADRCVENCKCKHNKTYRLSFLGKVRQQLLRLKIKSKALYFKLFLDSSETSSLEVFKSLKKKGKSEII